MTYEQRARADVSVRAATMADLETLVRFSLALAEETEGRRLDERDLREGTLAVLQSPSHGFYLVAEVRGAERWRVVGQLLITFEWSDWRNANFWWIQSVYIDHAWRRRGVFRRLYREVYQQARGRPDVCGLRLYVEHENAAAQAVYRKLGLVPAHYEVFEDDFILPRKKAPTAP